MTETPGIGTSWVGPAIVAAIVAGLFNLWRDWRLERKALRLEADRAGREREARVRDMQRALYAEIRSYAATLEQYDLAEHAQGMVDRMRAAQAGGERFVPLIPRERNDMVFQALVAEIHVLPRETIDPVVIYYAQVASVAALIEDLRSADYAALPVERRIAVYLDYVAMKTEALRLANEAISAIEEWADAA